MVPSLLLHSLAAFDGIVTRALEIVGARTAVEIGAEGADFSSELAAWAERVEGEVACVDPAPSDRLRVLARENERVTLIEKLSPAVLAELADRDVYFLDGDHNYATVSAELEALRGRLVGAEHPALVVLHDVDWPSARRDSYYAPDRIAEDERHEFTYEGGIAPGDPGIVKHGFRGGGVMAMATREGGPRNGVLTAVEDFAGAGGGLTFRRVPAVFGLGFLFPEDAPWAAELDAHLAPYHEHPLLAAMERNRLALFVRVLELQDTLDAEQARHARVVERLQAELARLRRSLPEA